MVRIGSLFSGAGGLDMAVEAAFGGHTVWHCELDKAASKVLAHRWPGVPNLGDITAVDWSAVEPIDVLCGGFPCQDVSSAGRRAGIKDGTRSGLWSIFAEAIAALRPSIVIIENVRGLLNAEAHRAMESAADAVGDGSGRPILRAAGAVLGDLADLGYDAQWLTLAASTVGAPHRRERVFIVATDTQCGRRTPELAGSAQQLGAPEHAARRGPGDGELEVARELLPTPTASDGIGAGRRGGARKGELLLGGIVRTLLPTPSCSDVGGVQAPRRSDGTVRGRQLMSIRDLLPTPAAADGQRGQDLARANREGSGGDDLVTLAVKATRAAQWGKYEAAICRWEALTRPAPSPTEPNSRGNPRLAAAFSEWLMGWPAGHVTEVPGITRNDALRIVGNGVCPQQAHAAIRWLLSVSEVAA